MDTRRFTLKPLILALLVSGTTMPAMAQYTQCEGSRQLPCTVAIPVIDQSEVLIKNDFLELNLFDKEGNPLSEEKAHQVYLKGVQDRSGDPMRIVWYDFHNTPQKGVINNGAIFGAISAFGPTETTVTGLNATPSPDGQANAIDAYSWTDIDNKHDAEFALTQITNNNMASGRAVLHSGDIQTKTGGGKSSILSNASGNGVNLFASTDFGTFITVINADGSKSSVKIPLISGGSGRSAHVIPVVPRQAAAIVSAVPSARKADKKEKDPYSLTPDYQFYGKSLSIQLDNLENNGSLLGHIMAYGRASISGATDPAYCKKQQDDKDAGKDKFETILLCYDYQYLPTSIFDSGNGFAAEAFVFTPDTTSFSDGKTNNVKIGSIHNTGTLAGQAYLSSGGTSTATVVSFTYSHASTSGNGINITASTLRAAKHSSTVSLDNLENSGRITGALEQHTARQYITTTTIMDVNFNDTKAMASGNALSMLLEADNHMSRTVRLTLGNVNNSGRMSGQALLEAGGGTGDISLEALGVGNGISVYLKGDSTPNHLLTVGNINNKGLIKGKLTTYGGLGQVHRSYDIAWGAIPGSGKGADLKANPKAPEASAFVPRVETDLLIYKGGFNPSRLDASVLPRTPQALPHSEFELHSMYRAADATSDIYASGNGISFSEHKRASENHYRGADSATIKMGDISNSGVISGSSHMFYGFSSDKYQRIIYKGTGVGIYAPISLNSQITNEGIISGNYSALLFLGHINDSQSSNNPVLEHGYHVTPQNYGLMAGRMVVGNIADSAANTQAGALHNNYFEDMTALENHGTVVHFKSAIQAGKGYTEAPTWALNGGVISDVTVAENGTVTPSGLHVYNAPVVNQIDSYFAADAVSNFIEDGQIQNKVINGVGVAQPVLPVQADLTLKNTVVNALVDGVSIQKGHTLTLGEDSIINSNGFEVRVATSGAQTQPTCDANGCYPVQDVHNSGAIDTPYTVVTPIAILGDDSDNALTLQAGSIVNGDIRLGQGSDTLRIEQGAIFNGDSIDLGEGTNKVIVGNEDRSAQIRLDYAIKGISRLEVMQPAFIGEKVGEAHEIFLAAPVNMAANLGCRTASPDTSECVPLAGNNRQVLEIAADEHHNYGQIHMQGGRYNPDGIVLKVKTGNIMNAPFNEKGVLANVVDTRATAEMVMPRVPSSEVQGLPTRLMADSDEAQKVQSDSILVGFKLDLKKDAPNELNMKAYAKEIDFDKVPEAQRDTVRAASEALKTNIMSNLARKYWDVPTMSVLLEKAKEDTKEKQVVVKVSTVLMAPALMRNLQLAQNQLQERVCTEVNCRQTWARFQINTTFGDLKDNDTHYRTQSGTLSVGASAPLNVMAGTTLGGSLHYMQHTLVTRKTDTPQTLTGSTFQASLGWAQAQDNRQLQVLVGYAFTNLKSTREIANPVVNQDNLQAKGDTQLYTLLGSIYGQWAFDVGQHTLMPYAQLDYQWQFSNGYQETGVGNLGLRVDSHVTQQMTLRGGLALRTMPLEGLTLRLHADVGVNVINPSTSYKVYAVGSALQQNIEGAQLSRYDINTGLQALYSFNDSWQTGVFYNFDYQGDASSHNLGLKAFWSF